MCPFVVWVVFMLEKLTLFLGGKGWGGVLMPFVSGCVLANVSFSNIFQPGVRRSGGMRLIC